jgi:NaMN:DMB phosphoribosyltransferase
MPTRHERTRKLSPLDLVAVRCAGGPVVPGPTGAAASSANSVPVVGGVAAAAFVVIIPPNFNW